jgi:hypothetical protein
METNDQKGLSREQQITDLVNSEESRSLAFEPELGNQEQAAEAIAAMANSGGGQILLGVEEPGKPVGLADLAKATEVAKEAAQSVSPAVEVTVDHTKVKGRTVALVEVPAGPEPVLPPKGPIAKRDAAGETRAVSGDDVKQAFTQGGKSDEQGFAEVNGRLIEMSKELRESRAENKEARSLRAQLPGILIGAFIGAAIGVGFTALFGL